MAKGKQYGTIALVAIVAVVGTFFGVKYLAGGTELSGYNGGNQQPVSSACPGNDPSVVTNDVDALNSGVSVVHSKEYRLDGTYTLTSPTTKGTVDILFKNSTYLNAIVTGKAIGCGTNLIQASQYAGANATMSVYGNTATATVIGGVAGQTGTGVNNETKMGAGQSYNNRIHLVGTDKKSTGTMLLIIDFTNKSSAISSVVLSGATPIPVPNGYTTQTSGGAAFAFLIPALIGAQVVDYNLQIVPTSGSTITSAVYTNLYVLQPFTDTNGNFVTPGTTLGTSNQLLTGWDSNNAAKYFTYQPYNWLII